MIPKESGFSFDGLFRGLIGITLIIILSYILSDNKKAISWKLVLTGLVFQTLLGIGVIYFPLLFHLFEFIGKLFIGILSFTKAGSQFVFGNLADSNKLGFVFAFQILPPIVFFSALTSVLYYYGIIQLLVKFLAGMLQKLFKISGAESLVAGANIFLGQSEAPILIKSYLNKMTLSELFLVMVAGMSTLAGGILAAYIGFLGGNDPVQKLLFAKHLIAASVMAAPGAILIAKIIIPQTKNFDNQVHLEKSNRKSNILNVVSNGTLDGLKLAINVAGMLIVFIAFIAMFNFIADKIGHLTGINSWIRENSNGVYSQLSLQSILGYIFAPIMWTIGISTDDILQTGRLLGEKIILTEFIGYKSLNDLKQSGVLFHQKSIIMSTYFLSGFANFASIGIQIAAIGSLAPAQKSNIASLGLKAMVAGTLASLLSACIIGIFIG